METLPIEQAAGRALSHDLTQIIPGESKQARFRKGYVLRAEDMATLRSMGKEHVLVETVSAAPVDGQVHEAHAAARLARHCKGAAVRTGEPSEGKVELFATADGCFDAHTGAINAINMLGELAVAVRRPLCAVRAGDKLGAVKVIPLFVAEEKLRAACELAASPLLSVLPFTQANVCLVITGSEVARGLVKDGFTPVLREKLQPFGMRVLKRFVVEDSAAAIGAAITQAKEALAAAGSRAGLILCTGGMAVDPDDKTPGAIRQSGAECVCHSVPVFPGALFMLSYFEDGTALAGLPGCVMYAKKTIFDIVLPALAAGKRLGAAFFTRMGAGGLCLDCPHCIFPNCAFGSGGM
ncbi:MAG: molybdopterin-binding protein [Spirochaetaceae bacterium]|jgi:molybdopterin biosynthesis enzyme|nr:molybdopterin-binding protein [Spirochaetaceae bacterium]